MDTIYRRATSSEDLNGAFTCLYSNYLKNGFISPNKSGRYLIVQHLLDTTDVFVAAKNDKILGTLTVVKDNLPMKSVFKEEIDKIQHKVVEFSCLSICDSQPNLTIHLMSIAAQSIRDEYDGIVIVVNPSHERFYTNKVGFERIGKTKIYAMVNGLLAVPMYMNFEEVKRNAPEIYNRYFDIEFPSNDVIKDININTLQGWYKDVGCL